MGQTIICEYLAEWESTGTQPNPTDFGFDGLYSMLEECQDTMLKLGTAANDGKRHIADLELNFSRCREDAIRAAITYESRVLIQETKLRTMSELEEQHLREIDRQAERIAELETQLGRSMCGQSNERMKEKKVIMARKIWTDGQLMDMAFEAEDRGNFHEILCRVAAKYDDVIAELEGKLMPSKSDGDGWIPWSGGECPVDSRTIIEVKFLSGAIFDNMTAGAWKWKSDNDDGTIVAYRIAD